MFLAMSYLAEVLTLVPQKVLSLQQSTSPNEKFRTSRHTILPTLALYEGS